MKVFLSPEVVPDEQDKGQIATRVKEVSGRKEVEVLGVRKVIGEDGKIRGFEVDIR